MNLPTRQQLIAQRMDELAKIAGDDPETQINHLTLQAVTSMNRSEQAIDMSILGNALLAMTAKLHSKSLDAR